MKLIVKIVFCQEFQSNDNVFLFYFNSVHRKTKQKNVMSYYLKSLGDQEKVVLRDIGVAGINIWAEKKASSL